MSAGDENSAKARGLACWSGPVTIAPVSGGLTNANFCVAHGAKKYFVRIGADIPVHGVMRFNELAATRAAAECGISPGLFHHEPGAIVLDWVEGAPLSIDALKDAAVLTRVTALVRRAHAQMTRALRGPALAFDVFHVLRDYATALHGRSAHLAQLPRFAAVADELEAAVTPSRIVLAHNDLLPANVLDDGARLWLIDWDYAGFNDPLFDLANLAANFGLSTARERDMLRLYFDAPPDSARWKSYRAFVCASLLRETMWSMVSELHSKVDFDFRAYALNNNTRFERAYADFLEVKDLR